MTSSHKKHKRKHDLFSITEIVIGIILCLTSICLIVEWNLASTIKSKENAPLFLELSFILIGAFLIIFGFVE